MLYAPHHVQSIPARAPRGNHGAKYFLPVHSTENVTVHALTCAHAPLYSALGGFVIPALLPLRFRVFAKKRTVKRDCATANRNLVNALQ
jgi:hypothetical protein